jgi:hypothetical protein
MLLFWAYLLIKKGKTTKTIPVATRINISEIKYGNTISPIPLINGIITCCFFPYTKNQVL